MKPIVDMPESKFIRVVCKKCKNEQIIFNKATSIVKCNNCNADIATPTGGVADIKARKIRALG
ncbi:30S ribosomal protein S27e [archaeon]|nr:MAG: 30S ribosomal protein S27e [archaeon]